MQRVKGAMFFQLPPPPPAQHAIKISRLQCIHRLLSLSLFGRKPCVCVCMPHLPDFRGCFAWAARGAGEAFGITHCSMCARDICTGCELYALPAAAIQAQPVTLCPPANAGCLPSFPRARTFSLFPHRISEAFMKLAAIRLLSRE